MFVKDGILKFVDNDDLKLLKKNPDLFWKDIYCINDGAFISASKLKKIEIPNTVVKIGNGAFMGCSNLRKVKLPENLQQIEYRMFANCTKLKEVEFPKNLKVIENTAFAGCSSLKKISLPESLLEIHSSCFASCVSLTEVTIPNSVYFIAGQSFSNCRSLKKVQLSEEISKISSGTFRDCRSLSKVNVPYNCTTIESYAFCKCEKLSSLNCPEKLKEIQNNALYGCLGLKELKFYNEKSIILKGLNLYSYVCSYVNSHNQMVLSRSLPSENYSHLIVFDKFKKNVRASGLERYASMLYNYDDYKALYKMYEITKKENFEINYKFLENLMHNNKLQDFVNTSNFKFFGKEINFPCGRNDGPEFFEFAYKLGCFSNKKILNKNGMETGTPVSQKASSLLGALINQYDLKIEDFERILDQSASINLYSENSVNQNFLKFLAVKDKNAYPNFELLNSLDKTNIGLFIRTMQRFDEVMQFRKKLDSNGIPRTVDWEHALLDFYHLRRYANITPKNQKLAEVFMSKNLSESDFIIASKVYDIFDENNIRKHILEKELKEETIVESIEKIKTETSAELASAKVLIDELFAKQFTYEWLDKSDPRNLILGLYCDCCANVSGQAYGADIAKQSMISPELQNLVVKDNTGAIVAKGTIYVNEEHGFGVINDFEIHSKFKKHEMNLIDGRYNVPADSAGEKTRQMIFNAFMRGINAFVKEYDSLHENCPIKQINVGMDHNRLKLQTMQFKKENKLLHVPEKYKFADARDMQFILYPSKFKNEQEMAEYSNESLLLQDLSEE